MSLLNHKNVRLTIRARLAAASAAYLSAKTGGKIAYENESFETNGVTLWLRETMRIASERQVATKTVETLGITTYDVLVPLGSGTEAAGDVAQSLVDALQVGVRLLIQGQSVHYLHIDRSERSPGGGWKEGWWAIPVIFTWRAYSEPDLV